MVRITTTRPDGDDIMRYNLYGINCDYAARREFHRPFWDALQVLGQRTAERVRCMFNAQRLQREEC